VQQTGELQAEVDRLGALLKMPPIEGYRFEHARVAQRDFSAWWQRMVIRKGADYAIPVGAPVVYSGGIVGRVSEVHAYTSVVQLTTDPGLRIAAVVDGDTRPISYQGGDNQVFGAPKGAIEFVPLDVYASSTVPKRLATSAWAASTPGAHDRQDRPRRVERGRAFQDGRGRARPRLSELTEVTVLVKDDSL